MNNYKFLTLTTFELDQINGLNLLQYSMKKNSEIEPQVIVLSPTYVTDGYDIDYDKVLVDIGNKSSDKYYCKFVLPKYCSSLHDSQKIFYLDPDHYCFHNLDIPSIPDDTILVSSEIYPVWQTLSKEEYYNHFKLLFPSIDCDNIIHYNTSLLICQAISLKKIYPFWEEVYESLHTVIPYRHLEELSFSIASILAGIRVRPVKNSFQGNFYNQKTDCRIFHYGGSFRDSTVIKDFLRKQVFTNIEGIESCVFEFVLK